ncbi:MAG: vWA domain-containing protein [Actinomycetes bacterium]
MTLGSPWMLVALVLVGGLVAAYVSDGRRRAARAARLAEEGLVSPSAPPSRQRWAQHVPFAVFTAAFAVLVVAVARPAATVSTPRREGTVILAVDVSSSMGATDVKPSRIEAARAAATAFVARQPDAVRIGVVAFGNGAVVVQPPTGTHDDAESAINRLSVGGGTSVGHGLLTSLQAIAGKPIAIDEEALADDAGELEIGYYGGASIVVFSDGENVGRPEPQAIAEVASVAGVRVHTVATGTEVGTTLNIDGFNVATAADPALLRDIASTTDGTFQTAGDAEALAAVARSIDLRFRVVAERTEVTGAFAAAGVVLLLIAAAVSVLRSGRVL